MDFAGKPSTSSPQQAVNFLSEVDDNNIFHTLLSEILPLSRHDLNELAGSKLFIVEDELDKTNLCQQWRYFVYSSIFSKVQYISGQDLSGMADVVPLETSDSYDCWVFRQYNPNSAFIELVNSIQTSMSQSLEVPGYVLLNQRDINDRYLYDLDSGEPLEDVLSLSLRSKGIAFKHCNFAQLTPVDQAGICSGASVFVAVHGAGISNVIFTPSECPLIEINFRRYWFCDEVCAKHFNGKLKFDQKCGRKWRNSLKFHKADFHNLSYLLNRKYVEFEAEAYDGYRSRNPISRKKVFVDGAQLVTVIEQVWQSRLS